MWGQLLFPCLLGKLWQLSHNFTVRLMENFSVGYMIYFGHLLNCETQPSQSLQCQKLFQVFNTLWSWSVDECVCIWFASKSGGTNESQGCLSINWRVIFKAKGLNVAWWTLFDLMQRDYFFVVALMQILLHLQRFMNLSIIFMGHQHEKVVSSINHTEVILPSVVWMKNLWLWVKP